MKRALIAIAGLMLIAGCDGGVGLPLFDHPMEGRWRLSGLLPDGTQAEACFEIIGGELSVWQRGCVDPNLIAQPIVLDPNGVGYRADIIFDDGTGGSMLFDPGDSGWTWRAIENGTIVAFGPLQRL